MIKAKKIDESPELQAALLESVLSRSSSAAAGFTVLAIFTFYVQLFSPTYGFAIRIFASAIIVVNLIRIAIQVVCKKKNVGLENYLSFFITVTGLNGLLWGVMLSLGIADSVAPPSAILFSFVLFSGLMTASTFSLGNNQRVHLGFMLGMFLPLIIAICLRYETERDFFLLAIGFIAFVNTVYTFSQGKKYREYFKAKWKTDNDLLESQKELIEQRAMTEHVNRLSSIGEMAAGFAHEINNPLAIVIGNLEILEVELKDKNLLDEFTGHLIKRTITSASRISKIIKALRSLSRASSKEGKKPTTIKNILEDCLILVEQRLTSNNIRFDVKIKNDSPISCDPIQIGQVLINLINNACDVLETQPDLNDKWIQLETKFDNEELLIIVSNNGPVITNEVMEKVFTPFFTTKPVGQGMGLGLVISRSIAVQHGGTLEVSNGLGHTSFTLRLPL